MSVCQALPFLAPKRLVIVQGLLSRFERRDRARYSERALSTEPRAEDVHWRPLSERLDVMPDSTVLVFTDGRLSKDNPLLGLLSPKATVKEFPPLRRESLRQWIQLRVRKMGSSISPSAVSLLADLVGSNLWILSSEIEKLCLWAGQRRIEEEDVRQLVSLAREASVFAMVDAIVEGKMASAVQLLHQLLDAGVAAPYLLVMITRQFRLLLQAKELGLRSLPRTEMRSRLGLLSDYPFRKTLEQARHYSVERLADVYHKLLETDLSIKRGKQGEELALDLLITELCRG
jgi:DNA polymerase-3 subunit delta